LLKENYPDESKWDKIQLSLGKTKYNIYVINVYRGDIGLEFEFDILGHNCNGKCNSTNCWYFPNNSDLYTNIIDFIRSRTNNI